MKVCQHCGYKNEDTNNFCANCAAPFNAPGQPPAGPSLRKPVKKSNKLGCMLVLSFCVILAAGIIITNMPDHSTPGAAKPQLSAEAIQSLEQLPATYDFVTGYDFDSYEYPAIIINNDKIKQRLEGGMDMVSKLVDDMDNIGTQLQGLNYAENVFSAVNMREGKALIIAQWENGYVFFDEAFISTGVRVKHNDLVIQYTQTDESGYYPVITGVILNAGQRTLSSVYIAFNLVNAQGNIIGFSNDLIGNLKSEDTWQFSCDVVVSEDFCFVLSEITYF